MIKNKSDLSKMYNSRTVHGGMNADIWWRVCLFRYTTSIIDGSLIFIFECVTYVAEYIINWLISSEERQTRLINAVMSYEKYVQKEYINMG